jgi:4-hydroxy-4-methyl-2-oxoglutarate aldolase
MLEDLLARLRPLGTATVADAMDALGLPLAWEPLRPIALGTQVAGVAFTVRFAALQPGARAEPLGDYLERVPPGALVVADHGGRLDCSLWGDVLSEAAKARRLGGTLIHGACRDVPELIAAGYPIFSQGICARSGKGRVRPAEEQVPVRLGSLQVHPGDVLCADDSGVLVVPRDQLAEVVEAAERTARGERQMMEDLRAGLSLKDARARRAAAAAPPPAR